MKKLLHGFFFAFVLAALLAVSVSAETYSGTCGENLTWSLDTDTGELVISGEGAMTDYISASFVPWSNYRSDVQTVTIKSGVTSIGSYAFEDCRSLAAIEIPNGVTSIGDSAFYYCSTLTAIEIPDSVTSIGDRAFLCCSSLTSISITEGITSIGSRALYNCESLTAIYVDEANTTYSSDASHVLYNKDKTTLIQYPIGNTRTEYSIPFGVTRIDDYAFRCCSTLTTISIPDGVTSIGDGAFADCYALTEINIPASVTDMENAFGWNYSLTQITVDEENATYSSDAYGVLFDKNKTTLMQYPIGNERTEYSIPHGVVNIEGGAFHMAHLAVIIIPDSVTSISSCAFQECRSLTAIEIPDSVTSIGEWAFYQCYSLVSVTIPQSVFFIGTNSFASCENLTIYGFSDSCAETHAGENDIPFVAIIDLGVCGDDLTWTMFDNGEFYISGTGTMTEYTDPSLTPWSNYYSSIVSAIIKEGVTSISNNAFYGCNSLVSVNIPKSVTAIGAQTFEDCPNVTIYGYKESYAEEYAKQKGIPFVPFALASGTLGDNLTWAFYENGELTISGTGEMIDLSNTRVPWYNYKTSIKTVTIEAGITSIGTYAFYMCSSLESIEISDSVTSIGEWAFYNCSSLTKVTFGSGITSIGTYAFYMCSSLESIEISDSVTSIGEWAFYNCSLLTKVTLGSDVTSIGAYAFYMCPSLAAVFITDLAAWCGISFSNGYANPLYNGGNLYIHGELVTNLVIPADITNIAAFAFYGWSSLETITVDVENPVYFSDEYGVLFNKDKTELIQYPAGNQRSHYAISDNVKRINDSAFRSSTFLTSVTISDSVLEIGASAFVSCTSLESVILGEGVASIGTSAFASCTSLASLYIPSSVENIADNAFYRCISLTEFIVDTENMAFSHDAHGVLFNKDKSSLIRYPAGNTSPTYVIPSGVQNVGYSAFDWCNSLCSIELSQGVTNIGGESFRYCDSLTKIHIPDGVKSIGKEAFYSCTALEEIHLPNSVTSLGVSAFRGCSSLKAIVLGTGIANIDAHTFYNCDALVTVVIPESVGGIKDNAFYDCNSLKTVTIRNGVTSISNYAFGYCGSLTAVTIPESVTSIGARAFWDCPDLTIYGYTGSVAETYATENSIPFVALGTCTEHTYGDWVETKEATVSEEGEQIRTCTACGVVETEVIPKLDPATIETGDITGDGEIELNDTLLILQAVLRGEVIENADMNGDGKVNMLDVLRLLKKIAA